ncbi:hypothetical protein KCP70_05800 [Salmonella enterica subsp. enterica]|nr:hypothetical protein KCP70_05800 [Salmonella enterica subsp. enterica]
MTSFCLTSPSAWIAAVFALRGFGVTHPCSCADRVMLAAACIAGLLGNTGH